MGARSRSRICVQRKPSIDYFAQLEEREDLDDYGQPKKKGKEEEDDEILLTFQEAEEPAIDFWTDFDWEQFCMINAEDQLLKDALPAEKVREVNLSPLM